MFHPIKEVQKEANQEIEDQVREITLLREKLSEAEKVLIEKKLKEINKGEQLSNPLSLHYCLHCCCHCSNNFMVYTYTGPYNGGESSDCTYSLKDCE